MLVYHLQVVQTALLRQLGETVLGLAIPPVSVAYAKALIELDLERSQRGHGQGAVVALDQETLRGVLAVLSHLRGRRGGAHPFRTKRNILAAAAATLLRVIGGDVILTAVRVKDLENAKGNSQQRIIVLAHSVQLDALVVLQTEFVGDKRDHGDREAPLFCDTHSFCIRPFFFLE